MPPELFLSFEKSRLWLTGDGQRQTGEVRAMKELLDLVYLPRLSWGDGVRSAFDTALKARYPRIQDLTDRRSEEKRFQLRVNSSTQEDSVPYAALIPPGQELSGPYGGMSFVIFPADDDGRPALISMGIGTNGLAPDEAILGRPGHGRKCAAIAAWLNSRTSKGFAWAKRDPVRIDLDMPGSTRHVLSAWEGACNRYGKGKSGASRGCQIWRG